MAKYRKNVAAILLNAHGEILICERKGNKNAWQFPQGGVDKGEKLIDALYREVWEEVGLEKSSYSVQKQLGGYKYLYPAKVASRKRHVGQEQTYFLCRLNADSPEVHIADDNPEFQDYDWVLPKEFNIEWVPPFKRKVYCEVMQDFFGVELMPVKG